MKTGILRFPIIGGWIDYINLGTECKVYVNYRRSIKQSCCDRASRAGGNRSTNIHLDPIIITEEARSFPHE